MDCLNLNKNPLNFLHEHELKILLNEEENICSICNIEIYKDSNIYSCEICSLIICPQCIQMLYLIPKYQIPLKKQNLKTISSHNKNCNSNYMIISNDSFKCNECNNSNDNFLMYCNTCENFYLCIKCFSKSSNEKISFSNYIHEHPMKELKMDGDHLCDICKKSGNFSFSSFQCKKCDLDICEHCLDKMISIKQPLEDYDDFFEFKKVKSFYCNECDTEFKEKEKKNEFNYMFSDGFNSICIDCFYENKKIDYEIVNNREIFNALFFDSSRFINENEELKKENEKFQFLIQQIIILYSIERKKNNNENEEDNMGIKELKIENEQLKEKLKNNEEKINELNSLVKEKENDVKKNKEEMNKKLNQLYNSKDQIEKKMKEEITLLKSKINNENISKGNNKLKPNNLENEINKQNLKIEKLEKLINEKELDTKKLNQLIVEKEKQAAIEMKKYNEINKNYGELIKRLKEEKEKIKKLIQHFEINTDNIGEILNKINKEKI